MATDLMRAALRPYYQNPQDAHPGLLIQRGYARDDRDSEDGRKAKTEHLQRICAIPPGDFYRNAYQRWKQTTANSLRFTPLELALQPGTRLFIGLTGGGMLETGCAISHSYGLPYIPGSSIKGVVRAHVRQSTFNVQHPKVVDELFGAAADPKTGQPEGLSGLVVFHDAWWVPNTEDVPTPFVEEIVTSHHLDYYGQEGRMDASDLDSPIPNAQIAVRGHFLFVLEGEPSWRDLAAEMLLAALSQRGIGAKTRTGYGLFDRARKVPAGPVCAWVDETIARLLPGGVAADNEVLRRMKMGEVRRGKDLAKAWQGIDSASLKAEALADIRSRWEAEGWWESPSRGAKNVKKIYIEGGDT